MKKMHIDPLMKRALPAALAASVALALTACGGSSSNNDGATTALSESFPTGLTTASPTSVSDGSQIVAFSQPTWGQRLDDALALFSKAIDQGNSSLAFKALITALPINQAWAAPLVRPEGSVIASYIEEVASGEATPTSTNLPLRSFFSSYQAANCYGPEVIYDSHDQGDRVESEIPMANRVAQGLTPNPGPNAGPLPTGDVGMWLAREGDQTTGEPCSVAQLNKLIDPIKKRTNASLILAARLRAIAALGTGLPADGATATLTTQADTFFQTLLPTGTTGSIDLATISNSGGNYTYKLEATMTEGANTRQIAISIAHDSSSEDAFSGVLTYAASQSSDACGGGTGRQANVGTVRYDRTNESTMTVTSREAPVCVPTATAVDSNFINYMEVDSNGELDPTKNDGSNPGGTPNSKGWAQQGSGFKRFAATFNPSSQAGNYKFAWQAGISDSHSRMFAMNIASSVDDLEGKAFFGFSGNMSQTASGSHDLLGMICNWAGPLASVRDATTPSTGVAALFQYQEVTLPGASLAWNIATGTGKSKLAFAPTNNCNSTAAMTFDVNADGTLSANEGSSLNNDLDAPTGSNTVAQELAARGFANPTRF